MIFDTAYQTTMGSFIDLRLIEKGIQEAIIRDAIYNQTLDVKSSQILPLFILGYSSSESAIPFFAHPLLMSPKENVHYLVSDLRPFINSKNIPVTNINYLTDVNIKNRTEFNIAKSRFILNLAWLCGHVGSIKNELSLAGTVFSNWLSEVISKKYALDPKDQLVLNIACHYYYQSLFVPVVEQEDLYKFSVQTIKATRAPADLVMSTFERLHATNIDSIKTFCECLPTVVENVRLSEFNMGVLMTLVANSWYGLNSREIIAVALEHPPTWCSLVYGSLTERTFKNSMIARVAERYGKNGQADLYLKGYSSLVREFTQPDMAREELYIAPFED